MATEPKAKQINLALQGGGAHGAFTWGVLERILADERIEIAAISGTSAGALNGAAVKCGLAQGSRNLALDTLEQVWTDIGALTDERLAPWLAGFSPLAVSHMIEMSPGYQLIDGMSRAVSPYMTGEFASNALRKVVEGLNFDAICSDAGPAFHICATNVRTGKIKLFNHEAIGPDSILASACLPTLFPAVVIDGESYWDGGYTGNPALFPLFAADLPRDILIVNINPLERPILPVTAREIQNRINEISFNTSLFRELRAIHFVQRLVRSGTIPEGAMKDVLVHMVADDELMRKLSVATKSVANPIVMAQLRTAGQAAADAFLERDFDAIGDRSSVDLAEMFA
ncbi:patatin-like phospholipase family protein [Jannaschia helgolandensis]|jgi:NTE family protein|uniref:NTE family protein n=1 Tax=Jannaschia helgolandensis TaxID=188906 RepID=A0A1H7RE11_9RHOB|nr:patatin-like phospholipase family protein [Jannaschia helgolandensis]SEL58198.1 NTE family protein [Jannaschia helgolandensis]|tara:strand:- start:96 stop:1121 length:1026 start_codon:yes stop_codon:yes gene_type:complete